MKAVCVKEYFDNELHRTVFEGDEVELSKERFDKLSSKNNDGKTVLVKLMHETKKETKTVDKEN